MGVPHVQPNDRYLVTKTRSLEGRSFIPAQSDPLVSQADLQHHIWLFQDSMPLQCESATGTTGPPTWSPSSSESLPSSIPSIQREPRRSSPRSGLLPSTAQLTCSSCSHSSHSPLLFKTETARLPSQISLPNYLLLSKRTGGAPFAFVRRVLIEELYARIRMVFPDETSAQKGDEEYVCFLAS